MRGRAARCCSAQASRRAHDRSAITATQFLGADTMPVKIKTTGCLISIIASVVLTVVLNLLLRGCST